MKRAILRSVLGGGVGLLIVSLISNLMKNTVDGPSSLLYILIFAWSIGISNSFGFYLKRIDRLLNPALKLSLISWLTTRSGFLGFFVVLVYILYIITVGWLYGWFLLIRDLLS